MINMCGIFGFVASNAGAYPDQFALWSRELFRLSESRGKEAAGVATINGDKVKAYKEPRSASEFLDSSTYKKLLGELEDFSVFPKAIIGHSRLATNGIQTLNTNNQPVASSQGVIVHNGIIVNEDAIWKFLKQKPIFEVDTEVILALSLHFYNRGLSLESAIGEAFRRLSGSASIAFVPAKEKKLVLTTNTGSLYILSLLKSGLMFFASEFFILETFKKRFFGEKGKIEQIRAGTGVTVKIDSLKVKRFNLRDKQSGKVQKQLRGKNQLNIEDLSDRNFKAGAEPLSLYTEINNLKDIKRHDFDYGAISRLRRCSRCILPDTMPFINFDSKGVCNYCRAHKPIHPMGRKALEEKISSFVKAKGDGQNVIVAFSGGRDSSFGLHYLKKELGLNPIAYTYDWGMVTDLARRNQARMVGKLGVEHIVVSADITQKRKYIRNHILAWLKNPDLGMVPLFMQGDKQCVYYVDELSKRLNIPLVVYCRGNELENEEFKWGHCGIKEGSPKGVIHNLSLKGKMQIAGYYGLQYLKNPAYVNSSLFDTLFSYFSTYIQGHSYIFLWHYIPWNEEEIIKTLEREYGWEKDPEASTTWRIDDGSSAFYNYIYLSLQGFTENDTFRSNQIREGVLTRERALKLTYKENKPRPEALKWYFDRVGLDGDKVLSAIDAIPRLY